MRLFNRTLARFKKLQKTDYILLFLLCLVALTGGVAVALLDIGITNVFLKNQGLLSIGFDYLWVAVLMILAGHYVLILDRRKGYGAVAYLLGACSILWLLLSGIKTDYQEIIANLLFIYKYGLFLLMTHAIWSVSTRCIKLDFSSLRYTGVITAELCGYIIAGNIALSFSHNPFELLWGGFLATVLFVVAVKLFSDIVSIPNETFVPKTGGVQDRSEQSLVNCILEQAFCYSTITILGHFWFYQMLMRTPENVIKNMSWIWMGIGGGSIVLLACLYVFKHLFQYTLFWGMLMVSMGAGIVILGEFLSYDLAVYAGVMVMALFGRFYYTRYVRLLPCFLQSGQGLRIKTIRLMLVEPVGIIFAAALIMTVSTEYMLIVMGGLAFIFYGIFVISNHLYSRLLMQMCYLRRGCNASLMLTYRPLIQMLTQGLGDADAEHSLYCAHILLQGQYPQVRSCLMHSLQHPSSKVRLFAIQKLSQLFWDQAIHDVAQNLFQTDSDLDIQNYALSLVIQYEAEINDEKAYETYQIYLKNTTLCAGACLGLLHTRHGYATAIKKIGEWCTSSQPSTQERALKVMFYKPCPEWVPWVKTFLFHSSERITVLALRVASKLPHPTFLAGIFAALDNLRLRELALDVLSQYEGHAWPSVEKMITDPSCSLERRKVLIVFLGRQQSGVAKQVLLRVLFRVESRLRMVIVRTIMAAHMIWVHKYRRDVIWKSIQNDTKQWYEMARFARLIGAGHSSDVQIILDRLKIAFDTEMHRIRRLILFQVTLFKRHALVERSCDLLLGNDRSAYAGAASCLQDLLPKKIYKTIQPILLEQFESLDVESKKYKSFEDGCWQLVSQKPKWITPWISVLILLILYRTHAKNLIPAIEQALASSDWLVLDMALWLAGQTLDKKRAQELMLNVPTRYLVQHHFQEFLEGKEHDKH